MKKTHKTKSITCRIVSTGTVMQVNTIDEILSPGHYKIDACGVTTSDGFPDGVEGECLSAYLEVSDTNHSADNLKSAAVGQTLTYTDVDGDTAVYHRSGTNKNNRVEWSAWSDTAAVGLQNGSITSEKLSKDVRTKINSPLRPLFIAAGAEYNDSGADKTKTAPWGETVTHKAGHYYLNGLGDITEDDMLKIYNAGRINGTMPVAYYRNSPIRTTLRAALSGTEGKTINFYYLCNAASKLQVFNNTVNEKTSLNSMHATFANCTVLTHIIPVLIVKEITSINEINGAFMNCSALVFCKVQGLKCSLSFGYSPLISKDSVLYAVQTASPSSAITITLHPEAYVRLAGDADIVAALEEQPLVSLVSA